MMVLMCNYVIMYSIFNIFKSIHIYIDNIHDNNILEKFQK